METTNDRNTNNNPLTLTGTGTKSIHNEINDKFVLSHEELEECLKIFIEESNVEYLATRRSISISEMGTILDAAATMAAYISVTLAIRNDTNK